jgi:hypothetical protein
LSCLPSLHKHIVKLHGNTRKLTNSGDSATEVDLIALLVSIF